MEANVGNGMSCGTLGLEMPGQQQQSAKHNTYPYPTKPKPQQLSNEEEHGKKRISQWQRMKWTDTMVRLVIMVVFYIGDDDCNTDAESCGPVKKILQKKGKWKSVSKAMMEKGFYVSPQQCEDKFNDLNKRYKRVNDILGKGTACRVVENPSLLDSMDHLAPKMKQEVRKLLNSKHLYFKEMSAYYHNSGTGSCNGSGGQQPTPREVVDVEDDDDNSDNEGKQLSCEFVSVLQDGTKSTREQQQWMEEQRVRYQWQTFELEKQRLKWIKFSAKKERDMERMKLGNDLMRLENERMVLLLRKKELQLLNHHHQQSSNKRQDT